jgi:oxygen-independent coproporphyrinogen-3 oxidase
VIQGLMCNFYLDIPAIERAYGIDFHGYFAGALRELDEGPGAIGFVTRTKEAIEVTPSGRLFVRNICMAFDAYLKAHEGEKQLFSRTV